MSRSLISTALFSFVALTGCGGGGGDTTPVTPNGQSSSAYSELTPLTRYTGPKNTFQRVALTMPADGVVNFSLIGVRVRIFDASMRFIEESSYTPDTTYLANLSAGKYIVEFEYWSSNTRDAVIYSPALLSIESLPQLKSAVYSSSDNTTQFYHASLATESTINFSGQGVYIAILRSDMTLAQEVGASYIPTTLPPGEYLFHLKFSSSIARSVSITSSGLPV